MLSAISRPGEVLWVLSELGSRSGEMDSPKRDAVAICGALVIVQPRRVWNRCLGERWSRL